MRSTDVSSASAILARSATFGVFFPATQTLIVISGSPVIWASFVRVMPLVASMRFRFALMFWRASASETIVCMPLYYKVS